MSKKQKKMQQKKEDTAFNAILWACVIAILGSVGAVWYMVFHFICCLEDFTSRVVTFMW